MNFLPIYLLEIIITFISGIMGSAISNHLILELNYPPSIGSLIVGIFFAGFLISTLTIGHLSDKFGQKKMLKFILTCKIFTNAFYLIPIQSNIQLILFGIIYFFDGSLNGMFWPTVQQFSIIVEVKEGLRAKNKYMAKYNFSWNFGFLLGMMVGTIFVYFSASNYHTFYIAFSAAIIGTCISWLSLGSIPNMTQNDLKEYNRNKDPNKEENFSKESLIIDNLEKKLIKIPLISILFILFAHSFTDGALVVIMSLIVPKNSTYLTFLLILIRNIAMTTSTTLFSHQKEAKLINRIIIAITLLVSVWIFFIFTNTFILIGIILFFSGIAQGMIYACGMKLVSYKAKSRNSSRPFSFFQSTMSSGRMSGPWVIGFGTAISLEFGIFIMIIYDFFAIIQFLYVNKKIN